MNKLMTKLGLFVLILLVINGCTTNLAGRKQMMLVSEGEAIEASKQAYTSTLEPLGKAGKLDNDPQLVRRINRITNKLIGQAIILRPDSRNWQWSVRVIDEPDTINAWCMAGGKMAIYTGLINKLNATDDEIAQVMGHEISHALLNHSAERMSIAMAQNMGLQLLQNTTELGNQGMSLAASAAQIALTLPNSRTGESEADEAGIELAAKAGFNPHAAITLWQKMAQASGGRQLEFLSTHPSPENREAELKKLIPKMMPLYKAAKK